LRRSARLKDDTTEISQIAINNSVNNDFSHIANQETDDTQSPKIVNEIGEKKIKNKGGRPKGSTRRSRPLTIDAENRKNKIIKQKSYGKNKEKIVEKRKKKKKEEAIERSRRNWQ